MRFGKLLVLFMALAAAAFILTMPSDARAVTQQSGAIGVQGTIPSAPPTQAPTITVPTTGQTFNKIPITVAGLCPKGLLVEVFKNGVFAGAAECPSGSYSLQIDLFRGKNDLIARSYDSLNQPSPDSNLVSVTFDDSLPQTGPRISLFSVYAKRGALPGDLLTWPITLSGGVGPYAISIDWGDKTATDLISRQSPGDFTIQHIYINAGVYNIIIKATDSQGATAFLQVVGIGNGPIKQTTPSAQATQVVTPNLLWILLIILPLLLSSFWLGRKHQLQIIRDRLRRGQRPFK
ncbi:MAG TPA: hypothetical protein VFB03_01905 [Candidatus Saccharimonadales bacterium]|nr:hypothetical protein [Candidatus Saccharimonadales bacterium]